MAQPIKILCPLTLLRNLICLSTHNDDLKNRKNTWRTRWTLYRDWFSHMARASNSGPHLSVFRWWYIQAFVSDRLRGSRKGWWRVGSSRCWWIVQRGGPCWTLNRPLCIAEKIVDFWCGVFSKKAFNFHSDKESQRRITAAALKVLLLPSSRAYSLREIFNRP